MLEGVDTIPLGVMTIPEEDGLAELEVCRLEEDATGELEGTLELETPTEETGFELDGMLDGALDGTTGTDEGVWLGEGVELDDPTLEGEGVLDWET
jgi:hypothetical protein